MGFKINDLGQLIFNINSNEYVFDNRELASEWLKEEENFWETIGVGNRHITFIISTVDNITQENRQTTKTLNHHITPASFPFTRFDVEALFLKDISETEPEILLDVYKLVKKKSYARAVAVTSDFMRGVYNKKSPKYKANARLLDELVQEHKTKINEYNLHIDNLTTVTEAALNNEFNKSKRNLKHMIGRYKNWGKKAHGHLSNQWDKNQSDISAAVEQFKTTEKTYKEHMKLKAPVEYWTKKAEKHAKNEDTYYKSLKSWAIIIIASLFVYFVTLIIVNSRMMFKVNEIPVQITILTAGLTFVLTTGGIWLMRILTRVYLSEKHLRMDAEERAVMTQTYLALTHDDAASDKDRAIILASLFRPTEDGIVKDDAAPFMDITKLIASRPNGG